jgi:ABC-type nitrate/sulfonate/bicarbonate transport system substrate-binding protein
MRTITALLLVCILLSAGACGKRTAKSPNQLPALRYFDLINLDVRDVPLLMTFDALEAQGYKVEKTYLASSSLIADALARGDADIGMLNNQTMWIAISKGAPVRTIAQFTDSTSVLAGKQEIKSCAELGNRRVAMPAASGLASALFNLFLKENHPGVTPQMLVIPESAGRMAALLAGEIDASNLPGEELLKLQRQAPGKFHALMVYAQAFPKLQIDGLHVRRSWATDNPQAVKDFLRALLNVYRQITQNPQLLYDESVKRLSLDPATAKAICDAHLQMGIWHSDGGLTVENVQYTLDFLTGTGALQPGFKVEDVTDLSYLKAVLDESGR